MRCILAALCLVFIYSTALAGDTKYSEVKTLSLKKEFNSIEDWHVSAFQADTNVPELTDIPAKLCFWHEVDKKLENCFEAVFTFSRTTYNHQFVKELEVINNQLLVKFSAEFSGGGSGTLTQISFWLYDNEFDSFKKAGLITLTEQGEYKIIEDGVLITADANIEDGETHFSPHKFNIKIYKYDKKNGYHKIAEYLTDKKYPSFDDVDKIDVIMYEMGEIKRFLKQNRFPPARE